MAQQLEQEGTFRGRIISYGLNKVDSGARSIYITVAIDDAWDNEVGDWVDWREYEVQTSGDIWILKKDGQVNERQARSLIDAAGWNGDLVSIVQGTWQPKSVQIVVGADEYKGNVRYRINWINEYDRIPGGGNVSEEEAKAMQQQYGPKFRALLGNATRAATKPAGQPAKPPGRTPPKKKTDAAPPPDPSEAPADEDIPF